MSIVLFAGCATVIAVVQVVDLPLAKLDLLVDGWYALPTLADEPWSATPMLLNVAKATALAEDP